MPVENAIGIETTQLDLKQETWEEMEQDED